MSNYAHACLGVPPAIATPSRVQNIYFSRIHLKVICGPHRACPSACPATAAGKVFKVLGFQLSPAQIEAVVVCKTLAIEGILKTLRKHVRALLPCLPFAWPKHLRVRLCCPRAANPCIDDAAPPPPPPRTHPPALPIFNQMARYRARRAAGGPSPSASVSSHASHQARGSHGTH